MNLRALALTVTATLWGSLLITLGAAPSQAAVADRDCPDFRSQRAAQLFFLRHGGPNSDPHRLDADSDGIACEDNPAPYYRGRTLPSPAPQRPLVVDSSVRLRAPRTEFIAGEQVRLRAKVRPRLTRALVLQRKRPSAGWIRETTSRTNHRGRVAFKLDARRSDAVYRVVAARLRTNGRMYTAATSKNRKVVTVSQHVQLAMRASVQTGDSVRAVVTAFPARRNRKVVLQRREADGWNVVARGRESRNGRERFRVTTTEAGGWDYRAVVKRRAGAAAVRSNTRELTVADPVDATPPPVPTGLTATAGDSQVTLDWDPVSAGDLARYVVYSATSPGVWERVASVTDGESTVVTELTNGVEYTFSVSAVDTTGNESTRSASQVVTPVDTTAPRAPAGLTATAGDRQASLAWDRAPENDVIGYRVFQRLGVDGLWEVVTAQPHPSTAFDVTGLTNGSEYFFRVTAVDLSGNESEPGEPVSVTPG